MIWAILIISLGLVSARNEEKVNPEYLDYLRSSGRDEEFARLLRVDVSLVRPSSEQRAEGSILNFASPFGDMLFTEEQERQGANFENYPDSKWPNGEIPLAISITDFDEDEINSMMDWIKGFNQKFKNVQIVPHGGREDYVIVIDGKGCWSYVGRIGGQQPLSMQRNGCMTRGTFEHEIIHAAGCTHEHNRADRDEYVTVLWENIPEKWHLQYKKATTDVFLNILSYDYDSVMHYPKWAPGHNRTKDAFELPPGIDKNRLGQNNGSSKLDIDKVNYLYS